MKTLSTGDVYFAAYLLASGVRLERVRPGQFVRWDFYNDDGEASRLRAIWLSGEPCPTDAHTLLESYARCRRDIVTYRAA